jgi:hypothetical protein
VSSQNASDPGALILAHDGVGIDCQSECIEGLKPRSWLALVPGRGGWALVPARLSFVSTEAIGMVSNVPDSEFYLAHPALVAGHAATPNMRFKGEPRSFLKDTPPLLIEFRGRHYKIVVEGNAVALHEGGRKSVLGHVAIGSDDYTETTLLWAGDLDGDGQLDLILETGDGKAAEVCLMLSSAHKESDELVNRVGCQDFSG